MREGEPSLGFGYRKQANHMWDVSMAIQVFEVNSTYRFLNDLFDASMDASFLSAPVPGETLSNLRVCTVEAGEEMI